MHRWAQGSFVPGCLPKAGRKAQVTSRLCCFQKSVTTTAEHNHPQLSAPPAEAPALPKLTGLWEVCPLPALAAGPPTSTVLSLQPSSNSSRANHRALSHGQGEWKDRDGSRAGTDRAAGREHGWAEEHQPAHAPAPCQQLPLPPADWHISASKGMFWPVGTGGEKAISVWWLLAKPPGQRSKVTGCQGNERVGESCLGQQSPETVANC